MASPRAHARDQAACALVLRARAEHGSTRRGPPPRLQARWRRSQASGRGSNLPNTKSQPRTRTDPICYTNLPTSRVASPVTENFL